MSTSPGTDRSRVKEELRLLVEWALARGPDAIPENALARAAVVIADDVAVAVSTRGEPEVKRFHDFVLARGSSTEATVFRGGMSRTDRYWAAIANALAMTTAELDEGYQITPCHAGLYTVPALLAESEAADLRVIDVLRAEALAYELVTRIARGWRAPQGAYPPLYTHCRFSAIGAACAAALVQRVDAGTLLRALSNASTLVTVGPRNHLMQGAMVRNVWPAAGAWNGMMSVQWARCGIAGLPASAYDVFSGVLGFVADPGRLTGGLGDDWAVLHGYNRMHACHLFCNALVEALLELRPRLLARGPLDDVEEIVVAIHPDAVKLDGREPATTLAARFSVPHVAATTLHHGHASAAAFCRATLAASGIARLRQKVRVELFDMAQAGGHKWPAAVKIRVRGGEVHCARCIEARGGHGAPHPLEDVLRKVDDLTSAPYPRFGAVMRELVALAPRLLGARWSDLVSEATGG